MSDDLVKSVALADRIKELEAKLTKAVERLEKIAEFDHQKSAIGALRYHLPANNLTAVSEVLKTIASTDIQAWAKATIAELKGQDDE